MHRKGTLADELAMLRQRNVELELELRRRDTATVGDAESTSHAVSQPTGSSKPSRSLKRQDATSSLDRNLQRRGSGQHFRIRNWDNERIERVLTRSETGGSEDNISPVPEDSILPVTARKSAHAGVRADVVKWIVQPKLIMQTNGYGVGPSTKVMVRGPDCSVHEQFRSMRTELMDANVNVVTSAVQVLFDKHLQDFERPHLTFSAAVPTLFYFLREAELMLESSASILAVPAVDRDFFRCASIIRRLMVSSRFGKSVPRRRPEDITRATYVRELSALVGLHLDLVRLGFSHKKQLKNRRRTESSGMSTPQTPGIQPRANDTDGCSPCVEDEELRAALAFAGKLLAALQMDMDRLRDEASEQALRARLRRTEKSCGDLSLFPMPLEGGADAEEKTEVDATKEPGLENVLAEPIATDLQVEQALVSQTTVASPLRTVVDEHATANIDEASSPCVKRRLSLQPSDASTVDTSQAEPGSGAASQAPSVDSGIVDQLLAPTFGEFLEQQLLPLYIGDVPFETLRHLAETYCGIPLDSDDEQKAWKLLGLSVPQRPTKKKVARAADSPQLAAHIVPFLGAASSTVPCLASASPALTTLCEVLEKPTKVSTGPPLMRQQMHTSIVEKRRKEFNAPQDMKTSLFRRPDKTTSQRPADIKLSSAILQTPQQPKLPMCQGTPSMKDFAALHGLTTTCAPSPISMRKNSRGRMELQSSMQSSIARLSSVQRREAHGRSRSPRPLAHTPKLQASSRISRPNWDLLETPVR